MTPSLKQILDKLYRDYDFKNRILHDPIEFPHRYKRPEDIEISGFIASCFAYGRVDLFKPVIQKILSVMGKSPYDFLADFKVKKHGRLVHGLKYRFNSNNDICCLLHVTSELIKKHGGMKALFKTHYHDTDANISAGLTGLVDTLSNIDTTPVYGENIKPASFLQLFPSPAKGSACKRMNLFLRWMIRDKDIDFGIWNDIPKNKLVMPLDTHIARISKCLGLTTRSSQDWKMAVEITESLRKLDNEDPVKYDFALCHQGISRACSKSNCNNCELTAAKIIG